MQIILLFHLVKLEYYENVVLYPTTPNIKKQKIFLYFFYSVTIVNVSRFVGNKNFNFFTWDFLNDSDC